MGLTLRTGYFDHNESTGDSRTYNSMSKPGSELRRARIACAFLLVGSLCLASPARAQTPGPVLEVAGRDTLSSMVALGTRFMIRSEILHETREVIVAVPPGNEKGREKFPVLYVLDGGQNLLTTVSASRALAGAGRMPPVIVVVIVNESKELQLCGIERTPAGEGL